MLVLALSRFAAGLAATAILVGVPKKADATQTLLSDFQNRGLAGWVFTNGPEFPGAQGSLTTIAGRTETAARLSYDLSKGGNYVGASLSVDAFNATALGLWVRSSISAKARLRLGDASGQTLQYDIERPLEGSLDPSSWYRVVISLTKPSTYYGGANDGIPHLPISSVGVLAVPETGATGYLDFDQVAAINELLEVTLDPTSVTLLPAPSNAADLRSRLAVNVHTTTNPSAIDLASDAGFSVIRLDLLWQHSELTPGVYNFQEFDGFVDALIARGMRLHLILDYTNPLYPGVTDAGFASITIPAFAALARATARHFAGKHLSYEIWNEPNSPTFWPPQAGAAVYSVLCQTAIEAVHAGDPDAQVTTGGTSGFDYAFLKELLTSGGADAADALGVHPYRQTGAESVGHDLVLLRDMIETTRQTPLAVWSTEWGYSSTWNGNGQGKSERLRQAQLVTRELLSAWAMGFPLIVYYDLNDGGTDPTNADNNFGLLTPENADKPAMVAVRTLSGVAKDRRYTGLLQTEVSSLHALRLDGTSDTTLILWSDDPNVDTLVHLPKGATAANYLNDPVKLNFDGSGTSVTIKEVDGPVYVLLPGSARPSSVGAGGAGSYSSSGSSGSARSTSATGSSSSVGGAASGAQQGAPESADSTDRSGCTCTATPQPRRNRLLFAALLAGSILAIRTRHGSQRHRQTGSALTGLVRR